MFIISPQLKEPSVLGYVRFPSLFGTLPESQALRHDELVFQLVSAKPPLALQIFA